MTQQPTVRFGGGVWKHHEEVRAELQRRLDESDAARQHAVAEIDRVHTQCVVLLQEKNELIVSSNEAQAQLRRQHDELHAAKQNVTELMALLTQANEARTRLEQERAAATALWQHARDQEQHARRDVDALNVHREEDEREARRLRDLLYTEQERTECQQQQLTRQQRHLEIAARSNDAKERQIVALVCERDLFARKLAQFRSHGMDSTPPKPKSTSRSPRRPLCIRAKPGASIDDSCENVTWTEVAPATQTAVVTREAGGESPVAADDTNVLAFEHQKQRLRDVALQTRARLEKEREQNAALVKRIEALERSQHELLVRYREASKARRRRCTTTVEISSVVAKPVHSSETSPVDHDGAIQAA